MNDSNPDIKSFQNNATIVASIAIAVFAFIMFCLVCTCCYSFLATLPEVSDEDMPSWSTEQRNTNRKIRRKKTNRKMRASKLSQQLKNYQPRRLSIFVV